jgi:ketopantoate reductase
MQNGVGNEDPFRSTYPQNTIISGVVWIGATQTSPGLIKHMQAENTEVGLFPNPGSDPEQEKSRLEHFASIMQQGGTNISVEDDVQVKRWEKVVWNAAWNTIGSSRSKVLGQLLLTSMQYVLLREIGPLRSFAA